MSVSFSVIPAKAGNQSVKWVHEASLKNWTPASAGVTNNSNDSYKIK